MVAVNTKWSSSRLSPKATVQLLLMCLSVGHWIGSTAGRDLDQDYSTTPIKYRRTTPWIRSLTRPHGYLPKQTTTPVMGRSTLKPVIPEVTTHSTTLQQRLTTNRLLTRPLLTAATGLATATPPAVLATSSPHPELSTPAPQTSLPFTGHPPTTPPPLTQRRSTRSQLTNPPTQPHFTDEHHPTTRHPPRTDGRPTEGHHPHHTVKPPPPETEEPHPPSKPHKPTQSHPITTHPRPITTQAQPITTQAQPITTKKGHTSSHSTTRGKTAVPSTWRPKTHSPHQDTTVQLILQISWTELCPDVARLRSSISKFAGVMLNLSNPPDVELLNDTVHCPPKKRLQSRGNALTVVQVDFCIVSKGTCDSPLTESVGLTMQGDITQLQTYLEPKVLSVNVYKPIQATLDPNKNNEPQVGIATGLSVTTLLAVIIGTVLAYRVYRSRLAKRHAVHNRYYFDGKTLHDTLNESHQLSPLHTISSMPATLHQLMPAINEGLVMDDEDDGVSKMYLSHVLSMHALSQFYSYVEAIVEEYETLVDFQTSALNKSQSSPKHFLSLPGHGHSQAHGHSNPGSLFHPPPKTRITLEKVSPTNQNGFLNANLVKGYGKGSYSYIATAAPWGTSLADFWEMVWEQQSRTLICLCSPEEMGVVCPWYWPREEGIQAAQLYGDILVMRQGCVVSENYCMSSLLVKNIQKNLCRPITHFWFTQWPTSDVPASTAVMISFLLQVRQTVQDSYGPIVAHCSDGCGRTGTLLAMDSGMRSLEDLCTVDVPSIVCSIRHDRGAAVLLREHYAFIYKVLYEYSVMLTRGLTDNIDADISLC